MPEHHPHDHAGDDSLPDLLELDAEIFAGLLDDEIAWAAAQIGTEPRTVADLGAGTGTGSRALARRFPGAEIVAVDNSAGMLAQLTRRAAHAGLDGRIRPLEADLDVAWPPLDGVDLAWAAASLHHLADPDRVMRDVRKALSPGGVLVVVEMDEQPRFLSGDLKALEDRVHGRLTRWNVHPDWQPHLEQAGFTVTRRAFTAELDPPPPAAGRYAIAFLRRVRAGLADDLTPADGAALDELIAAGPHELLQGNDFRISTRRTAWAAR